MHSLIVQGFWDILQAKFPGAVVGFWQCITSSSLMFDMLKERNLTSIIWQFVAVRWHALHGFPDPARPLCKAWWLPEQNQGILQFLEPSISYLFYNRFCLPSWSYSLLLAPFLYSSSAKKHLSDQPHKEHMKITPALNFAIVQCLVIVITKQGIHESDQAILSSWLKNTN